MPNSSIGQFRQEFWSSVDAEWVPEGWAGPNVRCPTADENLRISLYLARRSVGIYPVRTHLRDPGLPGLVEPYLKPLERALKRLGEEVSEMGETFLRVDSGTRNRAQWADMAEWLRRHREIYLLVIMLMVRRR